MLTGFFDGTCSTVLLPPVRTPGVAVAAGLGVLLGRGVVASGR